MEERASSPTGAGPSGRGEMSDLSPSRQAEGVAPSEAVPVTALSPHAFQMTFHGSPLRGDEAEGSKGQGAEDDGESSDADPIDTSHASVYVSTVKDRDLLLWRHVFGIKPNVTMRVPNPDERVFQGDEGEVAVYEQMLRIGVRFPLHPSIVEIQSAFRVAPVGISDQLWEMTAPSLLSGLGKKKGKEPQQAPRKSKAAGPTPVEPSADSHKRKGPEVPTDPRPILGRG